MLKIEVWSFSFKKGLPKDESENGGGFVFDCRGIENPGRYEPYKKMTGRDKPVQDFLLEKTRFPEFIDLAKKTVAISVENYLQRNFDQLIIAFGCTGGQHRSVFSADEMAKFLQQKYPVQVEVKHWVQEEKNWINE